jgi:hypothetical protein
MSTASVYAEDILDDEWPPQLMTEEQLFIANGIYRAADQRLRWVIAGAGGLRVGAVKIPSGKRVWYSGEPLPADGHECEGFAPKFSFWYSPHLRTLASLRRRGLVIEDPEQPRRDVLMLDDRAKNYVGELLMCCVRFEQQRRARLFGYRPPSTSPLSQPTLPLEQNAPTLSSRGP